LFSLSLFWCTQGCVGVIVVIVANATVSAIIVIIVVIVVVVAVFIRKNGRTAVGTKGWTTD
jgi:hypothetical protein